MINIIVSKNCGIWSQYCLFRWRWYNKQNVVFLTGNVWIIEFYYEHVLLTQASDWMSSSTCWSVFSYQNGQELFLSSPCPGWLWADPPFCEMVKGGAFFPRNKLAWKWKWLPIYILCQDQDCMKVFHHFSASGLCNACTQGQLYVTF